MKISERLNRLAQSHLATVLVSSMRVPVMLAVAALAQPIVARSADNVWNAYQDFYLDPTATGWQGAASPSSTGSAWGYYAANVNGYGGYPRAIGAYFGPGAFSAEKPGQNLYAYSPAHQPLGPGNAMIGTTKWDDTKGTGFPRYADDKGWGSSLGRYDLPWFPAAPGYAAEGPQPRENRIWMQAGYLKNTGEDGKPPAEGICPVLVWKAPTAGTFSITGSFLIGRNGEAKENGASIAIVDSKGDALMQRTSVEQGKSYEFKYSKQYAEGDVVEFQVGTDYKIGTPVGLDVTISASAEKAP